MPTVTMSNTKMVLHHEVAESDALLLTMHVHHPWRGTILWSCHFRSTFFIFAFFLILIFLKKQRHPLKIRVTNEINPHLL